MLVGDIGEIQRMCHQIGGNNNQDLDQSMFLHQRIKFSKHFAQNKSGLAFETLHNYMNW